MDSKERSLFMLAEPKTRQFFCTGVINSQDSLTAPAWIEYMHFEPTVGREFSIDVKKRINSEMDIT